MQFIENIFLLQCLEKEIATAKELDLRLLGKVIIFRDRQTAPIICRYNIIDYQEQQQQHYPRMTQGDW